MAQRVEWKPRGVVQGEALRREAPAGRFLPTPPLDAYVEHFWTISWDLSAPVLRETLPHPSVHLVIEAGRSGLAGVAKTRFSRTLEGRGRVFGIKFLPGCFHPFRPLPLSGLTNRVLSLVEGFGPEGAALEAAVLACGEDEVAAVAVAEAFLLQRLPTPDPRAERARQLVERIRNQPDLLRVETLAEGAGLSMRALQRLFSEYVGVSPKWVLQRYRLHEAMARLEAGETRDLAALSAAMGYFDQAHFIKDFKLLIGRTPASYAKG